MAISASAPPYNRLVAYDLNFTQSFHSGGRSSPQCSPHRTSHNETEVLSFGVPTGSLYPDNNDNLITMVCLGIAYNPPLLSLLSLLSGVAGEPLSGAPSG